MVARLKREYPDARGDSESAAKIVNFVQPGTNLPSDASETEVQSFEPLMLPHLDAAYNLARWLVGNEQDAQDVVQETYLRALKSFGGFHGSNGRPWLLTIVRNTSYTFLKKKRPTELAASFDEAEHVFEDDSASPINVVEQGENAKLVREALDHLPVDAREILVLRHLEDLSYREIAEIAQVPPGTVMSRLARARGKLRKYLSIQKGRNK
jgi:RNA polymerase sigma-70 factor (ECF subfamily)